MKPADEELLLNAGLDGELDVERSQQLQARLADDPVFRAAWERQRALSAAIRGHASYHRAPPGLADRLTRHLTPPNGGAVRPLAAPPARRRWLLLGATVGLGLLGMAVGRLWEQQVDAGAALAEQALAGHSRALLAERTLEVVSSDQHRVRPWLSERLGFAAPVPELSAQGFELLGARRDLLDGQAVAALVYRRRQHLISVFVCPRQGEQAPKLYLLRGFHVIALAHAGMGYWLVSDLNPKELGDLAELLRGAS